MASKNDFQISKSALLKILRPEERERWKPVLDRHEVGGTVLLSALLDGCDEYSPQDFIRVAGAVLPEKFRLHLCGVLLSVLPQDPTVSQGRQILADHLTGISPPYAFDRVKVAFIDGVESALKASPEAKRHEGTTWTLTPAQHGLRAAQEALTGDLNRCAHSTARALSGGKGGHLVPTDWTSIVTAIRTWMEGDPPVFGSYQEPPPRRTASPNQVEMVRDEIRRRRLRAMSLEELEALLGDDTRLSLI